MAQTAYNDIMDIATSWTLISEINCTFVVEDGDVEIIGMDGAAPTNETGVTYREGEGEEASTDVLARFAGAGTADRIYARGKQGGCRIFLSRAAVA